MKTNTKKIIASSLAVILAIGMTACNEDNSNQGGSSAANSNAGANSSAAENNTGLKTYENINVGEDFTDLTATISFYNHRTDLDSSEYNGKTWKQYIEDFNKVYPNITVNILTDTDYAENALTHLQSGDYETIMMIPAVDKSNYEDYFLPYGDLDTMEKEINYAIDREYGKKVYGIPSTAGTVGIVYNKKVFEQAGIKELPKTPDEFIETLKQVKANTDAIPLYTNYAAGWTMGAWDAYIGINSTGDENYMNQGLIHTDKPFKNYGDDTHPYAVYKILYDAVSEGLTEEDYTTTDWEGSKTRMNNGEIATMVLGSWAYPQIAAAGEHSDDIAYMPFPITINGKQYAFAGSDYAYGINKNASQDEQQAALVFVKWMTDESGYVYNEYGLPVSKKNPETRLNFENVELMDYAPALEGEEDLLADMNSETELNFNADGNQKIQEIIEAASTGSKSFDEIMDEWNDRWSAAQEKLGIEVNLE